MRYKKYLESTDRLSNVAKILKFSNINERIPSDGEMTELGRIVMGELVSSTGVRPIVTRHLTVGAYVDKKPGFNPKRITKKDCIVDEEDGGDKIYRRLNPNTPPKDRACIHQLETNFAECPVRCDNRYDPEGYNIYVTWDKTQTTKGSSYIHIAKPVKDLMDLYDITRSRFFKGRKSPFSEKDDWLDDDQTPFFLTSACSTFKSLNLKHISEAMGIDITAYSFRKIVSTWALSHESKEIRNAEEEALQHSNQVARDSYQQNKQIKPQRLTQTYIEDENLFPQTFIEEIDNTDSKAKDMIKATEKKRTMKRIENLVKGKENTKLLQIKNKPLGPKHRVLGTDKQKFKELIQDVTGKEFNDCLKDMKPLKWRHFIVRTVCTTKEIVGEDLRSLWKRFYRGDLKWGVRDARRRAKERNWNRTSRRSKKQDRNSWIAKSIMTSCLSEINKDK